MRVSGKQSNNTAELTAIIEAGKIVLPDIVEGKQIAIVSDSEYAIKCVSSYGTKMAALNWSKDMPNKELVKEAYDLFYGLNVQFIHIMAHTGLSDIHSVGNDNADRLANEAIGCPYNSKVADKKVYLEVPFARKDEAKVMGAKWDHVKKKWYMFDDSENKEELMEKFCCKPTV